MTAATLLYTSGGTMSAEERELREIAALLRRHDVTVGASRLSRLARAHVASASSVPLFDYVLDRLAVAATRRRAMAHEWAHVIGYADPTGETAVRNVMRGRT